MNFFRKLSNYLFQTRFSRFVVILRFGWAKYIGGSVLIGDFDHDIKFNCDLSEHMGSQIFWYGYYSRGELIYLGQLLKPNMVFVDIGANTGEFSLFAAKRLPRGKVVAFEPVKYLFEQLQNNVKINAFKNILMVKKALADERSVAPIFTSKKLFGDGTRHEGLYTLIQNISDRTDFVENVEVVALDDYLGLDIKVDIMKLDVEGSEFSVLRGANAIIAKWRPLILMELTDLTNKPAGHSSTEILHFLMQYQYSFQTIDHLGKTTALNIDQIAEYQNIICIPDKP